MNDSNKWQKSVWTKGNSEHNVNLHLIELQVQWDSGWKLKHEDKIKEPSLDFRILQIQSLGQDVSREPGRESSEYGKVSIPLELDQVNREQGQG